MGNRAFTGTAPLTTNDIMQNTGVDDGGRGPAEAEAIAQGFELPRVAVARDLDALEVRIASIRSVLHGAVI
jgi:hypothetical protein